MAKLTLADTQSGYDLTPLNNNFSLLEAELQDKILYRDNPDGEPNQMEQELDMNSNRIYNLGDAVQDTDAVSKGQIFDIISSLSTEISATQEESQLATANQKQFDLTELTYQPGLNNIAVYINGVRQNKKDYTEVNSTRVVFIEGLNDGDVVTFLSNERQGEVNLNEIEDYIDNAVENILVLEKEAQIAANGQTVFNLNTIEYVTGFNNISVYVNGIRLLASEFDETDSTTVTLNAASTSGDDVEFLVNKFQEVNTVTATNAATLAQNAAVEAEDARDTAVSASTGIQAFSDAAEQSAQEAAASETAAQGFADDAALAKDQAESAASGVSQDATTASSAASSAEQDAIAASNSADAAATSESNAATSETNAANSASAASTSETNAATSESNAATSETNAAASAQQAEDAAALAAGAFLTDQTQTGELSTNTIWLIDSSSVRTRALPASPSEDAEVRVVDNTGTASDNPAVIERNGNLIMGLAEDLNVDSDRASFGLKYVSGDWRIV